MREVRFTEEQMVAIMREADREPVAVVAKRTGSANRRQHEPERGCYSACHLIVRRLRPSQEAPKLASLCAGFSAYVVVCHF